MIDAPPPNDSPDAPPADRHPVSKVTRLPYWLVAGVVLLLAIIWGATTMRARDTAEREIIGVGDDAAVVEQKIGDPPRR